MIYIVYFIFNLILNDVSILAGVSFCIYKILVKQENDIHFIYM